MDWQTLAASMPSLPGMPPRAVRISQLTAVLEGKLYAHIKIPFSDEQNGSGEYVPLKKRRPSVTSGTRMCRTVVDDAVALLFSEGHFPTVHSEDEATRAAMATLIADRRLNEVMIDAATRGSVGSVAIQFQVLKGKPHFLVVPTVNLTPAYDPEDPDELASVTEKYMVLGSGLRLLGYPVPDADIIAKFWFQRQWTATDEIWFTPWLVSETDTIPVRDPGRSLTHGLGFVPWVWIRNLPGGDATDGACTFEAAIDTSIRIDYTLSQAGRALDYAGDPKLVITSSGGQPPQGLSGTSANALILADQGDAKLLEVNGTAATASLDYVRYLRALALESVHGNRADADKMSAAQSGRALELMNQGLIWLADRLRISYGQVGLLNLLKMVCRASDVVQKSEGGLLVGGQRIKGLKGDGLSLVWPRWYAPSSDDRQQEATTLASLTAAGLMSKATAIRTLAATYDVEDVEAERLLIEADEKAADARLAALPAVQTKATDSLPA